MKKLLFLLPVVALMVACGNGGSAGSGASLPLNTQADTLSYALGLSVAQYVNQLTADGAGELDLDIDVISNGIAEGVAKTGRIEEKDIQNLMMKMQQIAGAAAQKKQEAEAQKNIAIGEAFLAENEKKEGVQKTASGLQYKVVQAGNGASPSAEDKVKVHYTGKLIDGTVFDSSVERGQPTTFGVNQVIPGWVEGLQLMKLGSKYEFYIPSGLAYGPRGTPARGAAPGIPGNSVLIFEVELIEINPES